MEKNLIGMEMSRYMESLCGIPSEWPLEAAVVEVIRKSWKSCQLFCVGDHSGLVSLKSPSILVALSGPLRSGTLQCKRRFKPQIPSPGDTGKTRSITHKKNNCHVL